MQVLRGFMLFRDSKFMKILHLGNLLIQLRAVTDDFPLLLRSDYLQLYWGSNTWLIEAWEPSVTIVRLKVRIYIYFIVFGVNKAM